MPAIIIYLLKLSLSLTVVYLFYQLVLRRLTFYNWNRWYLVAYSMLCFLIPFINISAVVDKSEWATTRIITWVPLVEGKLSNLPVSVNTSHTGISGWTATLLFIGAGVFVLLLKLALQFLSYHKMKKRAIPVNVNGLTIYQVEDNIIPFSFGNSIFLNRSLHNEHELQEIIQHEFIHVKQRHSMDIIWSEILCILNWYNPFAWLIKKAIRQNLEFIADNKVIETGIPKKEYQYLLLKVIGNNQYSIATPFNFSSLKKRIAMMNKLKSTKRQLLRMLFLLPATAILLLAFRSKWENRKPLTDTDRKVNLAGIIVDASTLQPLSSAKIYLKEGNITTFTDEKGFYTLQVPYENKPLQFNLLITKDGYKEFWQHENWGNFYSEHIKKLYGNTYEYFGLVKEANKQEGFSILTGKALSSADLNYDETARHFNKIIRDQQLEQIYKPVKSTRYDTTPVQPAKDMLIKITNPEVTSVAINNTIAVILLKNGTKETYDLAIPAEKQAYEKKYGKITEISRDLNLSRAMANDRVLTVTTSGNEAITLVETAFNTIPDTKAITVTGTALKTIPDNKAVTVTGTALKTIPDTKAVTVTGVPLVLTKSTEPLTVVGSQLNTIASVSPISATGTQLNLVATTEPLTAVGYNRNTLALKEKPALLNLGGLSLINEGQYVLIDGKEPAAGNDGKFKGTYRITFLDKEDAVKKYGDKGKNGAIIAETIPNSKSKE